MGVLEEIHHDIQDVEFYLISIRDKKIEKLEKRLPATLTSKIFSISSTPK